MSGYRDDLAAAKSRVQTLEAQIAERDAALRAREAELAEQRAELERLGGNPASAPVRVHAAWRVSTAVALLAIVGVFTAMSASRARQAAQLAAVTAERDAVRREYAERLRAHAAQLDGAAAALHECTSRTREATDREELQRALEKARAEERARQLDPVLGAR